MKSCYYLVYRVRGLYHIHEFTSHSFLFYFRTVFLKSTVKQSRFLWSMNINNTNGDLYVWVGICESLYLY